MRGVPQSSHASLPRLVSDDMEHELSQVIKKPIWRGCGWYVGNTTRRVTGELNGERVWNALRIPGTRLGRRDLWERERTACATRKAFIFVTSQLPGRPIQQVLIAVHCQDIG